MIKPFTYTGPEGYSPEVGALYPGKELWPGEVSAQLLGNWAEKGWLDDPANPSAAIVEPARPKRKAGTAVEEG